MCRIHAAATQLKQLKQDEKGAAAFEYGFTAALLAVVLILAAGLLGGSLGATFGGVASAFSTGPFSTNPYNGGQAAPAAGTSLGTSFCERPTPFLLSPGSSCQPSVSGPAVTVGAPATAG